MENTKQKAKGRWKLMAVLAVCAAPLIASYVIYYGGFAESFGRTNYGTILDPRQHDTPELKASTLDGKPTSIDALKGKWLMVRTGPAVCQPTAP